MEEIYRLGIEAVKVAKIRSTGVGTIGHKGSREGYVKMNDKEAIFFYFIEVKWM